MAAQKPLDPHQRELVNIIKVAHTNLAVARKVRYAEEMRQVEEASLAIRNRAAREIEEATARIQVEMEAQIARHASALDEAVIVAYNENIPIRRIALDGFGNRADASVHALLKTLRAEGRVGNRENYQHDRNGEHTVVAFPEVVDVNSVLTEAMETEPPIFTAIGRYVLFEATQRSDELAVDNAVLVTMDPRDPYFHTIQDQASFSADRKATEVILYENPYRPDELAAPGLALNPKERWMNPVAFWVAEHPQEARAGFDAAVAAAK